MEASLRVFLGDYMSDEIATRISEEYFNITAALELVNFPIPLPGTKVYKAIQSRKFIVQQFIECIKDSRVRMAKGEPVKSMMDAWINSMAEYEVECEKAGKPAPRKFDDREIALTILTFLFASQDATSSALTWAFQLLADHPDVLEKVYQEQMKLRNGNIHQELTLELMEESTYLRQVVKEILRLRPPVLMVPYQTVRDWPITPNYTIPKKCKLLKITWRSELTKTFIYIQPWLSLPPILPFTIPLFILILTPSIPTVGAHKELRKSIPRISWCSVTVLTTVWEENTP